MELNSKHLIIIAVGILIVVAGGLAAYFAFGGSNNTETAAMPENFTTIALSDEVTIDVPTEKTSTFLSDKEKGIVIYNDNKSDVNVMYTTGDLELKLRNFTEVNGTPVYQNGSNYIILAKNNNYSILISTPNKDLTLKIYQSINHTAKVNESTNITKPEQTNMDDDAVMGSLFTSNLAGYVDSASNSNINAATNNARNTARSTASVNTASDSDDYDYDDYDDWDDYDYDDYDDYDDWDDYDDYDDWDDEDL